MTPVITWIAELIWPTRCLGCRTYGAALCRQCLTHIPARRQQECIVCKRPSRLGTPCRACAAHTMVDRLFIAGSADHPLLSQAIYALKYASIKNMASPLAEYLLTALTHNTSTLAAFPDKPLVAPVPLYPHRQAERGFNQSELIARQLAARIGMAYQPKALERIRHTTSQVSTGSRWERLENMHDAFRCAAPGIIRDRHIILVDDICTTGATLDACARALKTAGAATVTALVLARG